MRRTSSAIIIAPHTKAYSLVARLILTCMFARDGNSAFSVFSPSVTLGTDSVIVIIAYIELFQRN